MTNLPELLDITRTMLNDLEVARQADQQTISVVQNIMGQTEEAYMRQSYGEIRWAWNILLLMQTFNDGEIVKIMLSKAARWADDGDVTVNTFCLRQITWVKSEILA